MKYLLTLLLFTLTSSLKAQMTAKDLVGDWKVLDVVAEPGADATEKKAVALVKPAMMQGRMKLNADQSGIFYVPLDRFPINKDNLPPEKIYWEYDQKNSYLVFYMNRSKKLRHAQFYVRQRGADLYFVMDESPAALKVAKK